ncbi:hypothetical protein ACTOVN_06485 [Arcanobacterium canis]
MSSDYEYFTDLVESVNSLSAGELRNEILSRPVGFWEPNMYSEWKESDENYKSFSRFVVSAIRSLDGSEDDEIAIALVSNLHLVIPWCCDNVAELSMLLLEEFAEKKIARVETLMEYVQDTFVEHPDFSDKKQSIVTDFGQYLLHLNKLKFEVRPTSLLDQVLD